MPIQLMANNKMFTCVLCLNILIILQIMLTHSEALNTNTITDFSGTLKFRPRNIFRPTSIKELQDILINNPGPFTTIGSLHSTSEICVNDMSIIQLNLPPTFRLSRNLSTFTASANMSVHDVLFRLALVGKALPASGSTAEPTIGGVLATDTAPATKTTGMYPGLISVKIMTIKGKGRRQKAVVQNINRRNPMFRALVANIGAIGVLLEATFKTVPNHFYHTVQQIRNTDQILQQLAFVDDNGQNYPFWRIIWFPTTDLCLAWGARPISQTNTPNGEYPEEFNANIVDAVAFTSNSTTPFLTKPLLALYNTTMLAFESPLVFEGPMRNMIPIDQQGTDNLLCTMAQMVFLPKDALRVRKIFVNYMFKHNWPNLPVVNELVQVDDYYMSNWNFQKIDPTAKYLVKFELQYLTAPGLDSKQRQKFRQQILDHIKGLWMELVHRRIKFKSHWGKVNFVTPHDVKRLYDWDKFKGYVHKKFLNPYLSQRLPPLDDHSTDRSNNRE